MHNLIKEYSKKATLPLQYVTQNGPKRIESFEIDCCDMKDYNNVNVLQNGDYVELFNFVKKFQGPCLYYFEAISDHSAEEIVNRVNAYKQQANHKAVPAIKKKLVPSKVLYVGKVKRTLWGRIVQHLGYYKVERTQGLQLFYWTKGLNLKLRLTIMEFEPDMANYMEVLEGQVAAELKPVLGKHR